jgi:acyl-CoA synthetase (NDP forming)
MEGTMHKLERVFNPRSVAVVGGKQINNYNWLRNVIDFPGPKYHVNIDETEWPGAAELGFPNYKSLLDIPGEVDFVIIAVPAAVVPRIMADCASKGVQGVHVFTAGFGETGTERGKQLEDEMVENAHNGNIRLVGPNCLGIFNPKLNIGYSGAGHSGESGNFAFISQSGSHANGVLAEALEHGFKMSKLVSMGNGVVVDSAEYLEYFAQDEDTEVIGMFLEGVRHGGRFFNVLREVCRTKPVLVWKVGETEDAARATSAHSATERIPRNLWDSMLRQCGAVRIDNVQELIDATKALTPKKVLEGPRLGLLCQGGGHATEMANVFSKAGFRIPALTERSYERLLANFDIVGGSYRNPIEGGSLRTEEGMLEVLEILDDDENLDGIVQELPVSRLLRGRDDDMLLKNRLNTLCEFGLKAKKPYTIVIDPTIPEVDAALTKYVYEQLRSAKIPGIYSFERTARALQRAMEYQQNRARSIGVG